MSKNVAAKSYHHLAWEERILEEKCCWSKGYQRVAGFDEAGRGPLAGPVVAAVFIITPEFHLEGLNDSKQLTSLQRQKFYQTLTCGTYEYGVGIVEADEIDRINIYQASRLAMLKAMKTLKMPPDYLLVDALVVPDTEIEQRAIIHGDALSVAIAAASVIAKFTRDLIMVNYDNLYPGYGFAKHKGYPTPEHYMALERKGPSPIHRLSFRLTKKTTRESMGLFEGEEVMEL